MADKNLEPRSGGVRVKAGVLPGVREIRRPDFTKKAADIEKAEAEKEIAIIKAQTDAQLERIRQGLEPEMEEAGTESTESVEVEGQEGNDEE